MDSFKGSYFFTNRLRDRGFVFAGRIGSIRGYSFYATRMENSNPPTSTTDASQYTCDKTLVDGQDEGCVGFDTGRLSVIYDPDGEPMFMVFQSITGFKGANQDRDGIDSSIIQKDGSLYNFIMDERSDGAGRKFSRKAYGINLDAAVGETFTVLSDESGESDSGETSRFWGVMYMTRKL